MGSSTRVRSGRPVPIRGTAPGLRAQPRGSGRRRRWRSAANGWGAAARRATRRTVMGGAVGGAATPRPPVRRRRPGPRPRGRRARPRSVCRLRRRRTTGTRTPGICAFGDIGRSSGLLNPVFRYATFVTRVPGLRICACYSERVGGDGRCRQAHEPDPGIGADGEPGRGQAVRLVGDHGAGRDGRRAPGRARPNVGVGLRLVPRDDRPLLADDERHRVQSRREREHVVAHGARAHVAAELTEHEEALGREDVGDAVGRRRAGRSRADRR